MITSVKKNELKSFTRSQLSYFYPDKYHFKGKDVDVALDIALDRLEYCFNHIAFRGYSIENEAFFSHLHSDHYSTYLYFLSNSLWNLSQNKILCDKLVLLNRALHSIWFSYKCLLPNVFFLMHPVGTVLGNAKYGEYLVVYQNVTVNSNFDEKGRHAPYFGEKVILGTGAKILGNKKIGDRVSITDVTIYNEEIKSDTIIYRDKDGTIKIKERTKKNKILEAFFK